MPHLAGAGFDEEHGDDVRLAEHALFAQTIGEIHPFEGARELLTDLKSRGSAIVLASSANAGDVARYLDLLDAHDLVDGCTDASSVARTKPAPDLVKVALDLAGGRPAVMIGDSTWDVEAANKLKLPTICVRTGGFGADELRDAGATAVFDSLDDLRGHLSETPLG